MCGRMTQQTDPSEIARIFDADLRPESEQGPWVARYNVAPTDPITVVLQRHDGRVVERHRWGLIPSWARSMAEGAGKINARAETVADTPAFRVAFRQRRCIVPADGFYEWRREGSRRIPFYLHPPNHELLAMAGLWSVWKDRTTGLWVPSAAVITTSANTTVGELHDRMPVILGPGSWAEWLDPDETDPGYLQSLLVPAPEDVLAIVPVSMRVNSVRNDGPDLIEPVPEPGGRPVQETLFG
jgi:putative SOS response-associated peptidase YedK